MLLDEIAAYLDANTTLTSGVDLFAVETPPEPDACVSIHEYSGGGPQDTFGTASVYEILALHVRARAQTYPAAMALADTVNALLYAVTDTVIGGHLYHRIVAQGSWVVIDIDTKSRVTVKQDFRVLRVP